MARAENHIQAAVQALRGGRVLAYPTEAVWGLGADPFHEGAVDQVLKLKGRERAKGLILVAAEISQFDFLLHDLPTQERHQLLRTWPGPYNWLVPHKNRVPEWIHGRFDTVAVRVSAHPVVKALSLCFDGAIVSTSANPQGLEPARDIDQARRYFGDVVEYCPGQVNLDAQPCQIRDLSSGQLVRA